MKAKVKASGEIIFAMPIKGGVWHGSDGKGYNFDELDFLSEESPESATIEGWVARDKDNRLRLHYTMPQRASGCYWQGGFKSSYLPDNLFPSVTWGSEPLKCRITITPIEDE